MRRRGRFSRRSWPCAKCTPVAHGQFLAFVDGDDFFGTEWLRLAYSAAKDASEAIWRPECLYHFCDFDVQSPYYAPTISVMILS